MAPDSWVSVTRPPKFARGAGALKPQSVIVYVVPQGPSLCLSTLFQLSLPLSASLSHKVLFARAQPRYLNLGFHVLCPTYPPLRLSYLVLAPTQMFLGRSGSVLRIRRPQPSTSPATTTILCLVSLFLPTAAETGKRPWIRI